MRVRLVALALALAVALLWAAGLAGPALADHVTGVVNSIQRPLAGAQVIVLETGSRAVSDSLGRYDLGELPAGVWSVRVVAVGYASQSGTVNVSAALTSAPSTWLMKPLHPGGAGLTGGFLVARPAGLSAEAAADTSRAAPAPSPLPAPPAPALRDTFGGLPQPAPVAPLLDLYLSPAEAAARATLTGPLGELLPQIATNDSLTLVSGGTSAPGEETWRQWAEKLTVWVAANPSDPHAAIARRTVAYARTRLALAAGATWTGYADAKAARASLALARLDTASDAPAAAFVDALAARLDATFVPGSVPPKPLPAPRRHARHHRKRRAAHH